MKLEQFKSEFKFSVREKEFEYFSFRKICKTNMSNKIKKITVSKYTNN